MTKLLALYLFLAVVLSAPLSHAGSAVSTGAKVLYQSDFAELRGKRVGLVTNHTAMVDGTHLIDLMHARGVQLVAVFAPEHGLRGLQEDGAPIGDGIDQQTGVRVYSLYGKVKKPTPEMLRGIDLLLFDIQSLGTRFYTYISTMGLAMQAASEAHVPFVVLDRPNPLGGEHFAGPVLEKACCSFVGEYPIPVDHGLTIGELALMIKGEQMLPGLEDLDLRVIRMEGWQRWMLWPETGLEWVRTSPNIPDFETALLYSGICFFEGTAASVGRGTHEPFKLVGFPGIDAVKLAERLNDKHLPGVRFESALFTPRSIPGMSSNPKFQDQEIAGVRIFITNPHAYRPVTTGIHLLCTLYGMLSKDERVSFFRQSGFDELAGTTSLRRSIEEETTPEEIVSGWTKGVDRFMDKRGKYLLY
jgi:uncharacterized protein YbbC (DUF1343 family)